MGWISAGLVAAALGVAPTITLHTEKPALQAATHAARASAAAETKAQGPARRAAGKVRKVDAERVQTFWRMPLDFEANRGQAAAGFAFVAHGPGYALGVSRMGLDLALHRPGATTSADGARAGGADRGAGSFAPSREESSQLQLRLMGATSSAAVTGLDPQGGRSNYFIGNDPAKWRMGVPHFNRVKIAGPYPGIDLVLYGSHEELEYDFNVAPGAEPEQIRLGTRGASQVKLDAEGNALLETAVGAVKLHRPESYQTIDGARHTVPSRFVLAQNHELQFAVGAYDRSRALVIDPVLDFAVGFGGSNGNQGMGMEVDATGNLYVTGNSCSADFPSTSGNFSDIHTNPAAKDCQDLFVTKLDPTASTLLFSDFIGGSNASSTGTYLALDGSDDIFVTGATGANDFPTVSNIGPSAPTPCGISTKGYNCPDGFILKLSPDGSKILFSSLLGGNQASGAYQVGLNPVTGDLTVLGATNSSSFLPAPTTLETTFGGGSCNNNANPCFNSFLVGLDPATGALRYGAYIGGPNNDWSSGLAFDTSGNVYVAGSTQLPLSSSLGSVTHTYVPGGGATASGTSLFVTKLNLSSNHLTPGYLTVVEADADTGPSSLAVDSSGNAYFGGATAAAHLPVTTGVFQTTNKSTYGDSCLWGPIMTPFLPSACGTGLVGKLDATGALSFLTYVGGTGQDEVESIALDSSDNVWLTGVTTSQDFPVTADSYKILPGLYVPFLAEMTSNGTGLTFASLIAGNTGQSTAVEIDSNNNVYVAGFAGSVPVTPGTYPLNPNVFNPTFVEKWSTGTAPTISLSATFLNFPQIALGGSSAPQTVTVQNTSTVPMEISVGFSPNDYGYTPGDFPESTTCVGTLAGGASCTITASFAPGPPSPICVALQGCDAENRIESLVITNNSIQGTQTVGLNGLSGVGPGFSFATNPIVFPAQAAGTASPALFAQAGSTGDASLIISNMVLSGPNASDFQVSPTGVNDCGVNPTSPGSLCNLNITFSPPANATGTRTATLTFTDNAGDSPQSIPVSGTVASANFLNISPVLLQTEFAVAIGTSTSLVLDLQNPSTSNSVQVTGLGITGTNAGDFSVHSVSCGTSGALPGTIAPGATCIVNISVTPAVGASGLRTATLTVTTSPAATGLPTVTLQADAVTNTQPGMGISEVPNPLNFGGLQVGETSNAASVILTISNYAPIPCAGGAGSCGANLVINSITPGLSDYSIAPGVPECTTFPVTILSGGYPCTFDLVFKPTAAGSRNTVLTITSNDPQGTVTVPIYGSGLSLPLGEALQSALDFGNSAIGVAGPPMTTTLLNAGQSPLTVSSVTATANFAVSANTCTVPLAPQATCIISVTFTPPSAGYFTGTLTITDNDALGARQIVTMAGTGATGPQLRITPPTLYFGNQAVNTPSAAQTLTLTSTGDTTVSFPTNALRSSSDFILAATTCGNSLAEGTNCTASVQFKPSVVTGIPESGTLLITDNVVGSPQPVYMQGTGVQATGAATTTTLTSTVNPAGVGASVTFAATVTGPMGSTIDPTGSVTFLDGTTTLGSGTLNGSGVAAYSTTSLSGGSHSITAVYGGDGNYAGSTSTVLTEVVNGSVGTTATTTTLTSSANPAATGASVTLTATVAGPSVTPTGTVTFLDGTTALGPGTLNASAQATYSTSTLAAGSHSITAAYGGDATFAASTSSVLTETVGTPGFSVSASPTAITVSAGSSGTTKITVTPTNGFSQAVSFACSGLPAASTCSFSPSTVTPTGGTAATTTVTVATNVAAASLSRPASPRHSGAQAGTMLALLLLGLGGVVRLRRRALGMVFVLIFVALGLAVCGCGGGGGGGGNGGSGGGSKTPAGTSTVTVTATAGTLTQSTTFTLTVQ